MTVRRYQPGDEEQIQVVFEKTFKKKRSLKEWEWKFKHNPKFQQPFILVYEEDGKILGNFSLWMAEAFIHGEKKVIGLRVDTMVDPDARGRGIYKKLTDALFTEANNAGIDYLYGFPAPKAKELFIRYTGALELIQTPRLVHIQKPFTLLSTKVKPIRLLQPLDKLLSLRTNKSTLNQDITIQRINKFDSAFDQLAFDTRNLDSVLINRDSQYLNWRYIDHPTNEYRVHAMYKQEELQGYVITKEENKGSYRNGFIVDLLAKNEEAWLTLIDAAKQDLKDAALIQTWSLPHTIFSKSLKQKGFSHKDSPMPMVGIEVDPKLSTLGDYTEWFITPGDVDSF